VQCLRTSLVIVMVALSTSAACGPSAATVRSASGARPGCQPLAGGCAPLAIAQAFCGGRFVATEAGCARRPPCEKGRARDLATGECLPRREVRALAMEIGMPATEDDVVVCESGELVGSVSDRSGPRRLGCLPDVLVLEERPPAGGPRRRGGSLDVVHWTTANFGADGASEGGKALCAALARQPGALASPASELRAELSLAFPDNDVSQVVLRTRILAAQPGISGSEAATELERVVGPMVEALRGIGGSASEATLSTRIRCKRTSMRPVLEAVAH